jgi:hypothetical protein
VTRNFRLIVVVGAAILILVGGFRVLQDERPGHDAADAQDAQILELDPRTGKTLHQHSVPGGYAVVALLGDGRVAVASEGGCPDDKGGFVTLLDASLTRVVKQTRMVPCEVARVDSNGVRKRFEASIRPVPVYNGSRDVSVRLGRLKLVETYEKTADDLYWITAITAQEPSGRVVWKRDSLGHLGVADVRDGRVILPVFGTFTPGSD